MSDLTGYQAARVHRRHLQCRHFNGAFGKPPCLADVDLVSLAGPRRIEGWLQRIPCRMENAEPVFQCDRRDVPPPATEEEIAAGQKQVMEKLSQTVAALALIGEQKGSSGEVDCPACGNVISWTRARNGHVWGQCATDGCLSWLQ